MDDDEIRDLVIRLSRPDGCGGHTIERAAICAEGRHLAAIVTWIVARGGTPEAAPAAGPSGGLHGARREASRAQPTPLRYTLPAGSLLLTTSSDQ